MKFSRSVLTVIKEIPHDKITWCKSGKDVNCNGNIIWEVPTDLLCTSSSVGITRGTRWVKWYEQQWVAGVINLAVITDSNEIGPVVRYGAFHCIEINKQCLLVDDCGLSSKILVFICHLRNRWKVNYIMIICFQITDLQ